MNSGELTRSHGAIAAIRRGGGGAQQMYREHGIMVPEGN